MTPASSATRQIRFDGVEIDLDNEHLARAVQLLVADRRAAALSSSASVSTTRDDVDARYADLTGAGYTGIQSPFDAFWGARYAIVADPDGTHVGLMSPTRGRPHVLAARAGAGRPERRRRAGDRDGIGPEEPSFIAT